MNHESRADTSTYGNRHHTQTRLTNLLPSDSYILMDEAVDQCSTFLQIIVKSSRWNYVKFDVEVEIA